MNDSDAETGSYHGYNTLASAPAVIFLYLCGAFFIRFGVGLLFHFGSVVALVLALGCFAGAVYVFRTSVVSH